MIRLILTGLLALASPALAQDDGLFRFGGDAYGSGAVVAVTEPGIADVFGAGERVEICLLYTSDAADEGDR